LRLDRTALYSPLQSPRLAALEAFVEVINGVSPADFASARTTGNNRDCRSQSSKHSVRPHCTGPSRANPVNAPMKRRTKHQSNTPNLPKSPSSPPPLDAGFISISRYRRLHGLLQRTLDERALQDYLRPTPSGTFARSGCRIEGTCSAYLQDVAGPTETIATVASAAAWNCVSSRDDPRFLRALAHERRGKLGLAHAGASGFCWKLRRLGTTDCRKRNGIATAAAAYSAECALRPCVGTSLRGRA